ncbi:MAG: ArnT family glycosyltransferase [Salibacteraceae bacterium]
MDLILLFGSFVIIIFSIFLFKQEKELPALISLVFGGLGLRLFSALDPFLHNWDERYHALVAKNLMNHPLVPTLYDTPLLNHDLSWVGSHVWLHKQPLTLWLISGSYSIFGIGDFQTRIPSIILSTFSIYLVYSIGKTLYNKNVAFVASFLLAINGLLIELTAGRIATDHVDVFFMFFTLSGIYLIVKNQRLNHLFVGALIGVSVGLAILTKWLPALIIFPMWLSLNLTKPKFRKILFPFLIGVLICCLTFLPWQYYIFSEFPLEAQTASDFNWRHFTEALEDMGGPWYFFINKIRINYGEWIYIPLVWLLFKLTIKGLDQSKNFFLAIWIFIPLIFFSIPITKMQGYLLFTAPAYFLLTGLFIDYLFKLNSSKRNQFFKYSFSILVIILSLRYSIERIKPFKERAVPEWKQTILELKDKHPTTDKMVIFNCDNYIECMFYTNFVAYDKIPTQEDLETIKLKGYSYLILNE